MPLRHVVPVLEAQRSRRVLRERVAVPLAVRRAHERRDDLEVPFRDLRRLAPEVGETEIDIELEKIDAWTFRSIAKAYSPTGGENGTYGGHVFAQAAWAAAQTVDEGFLIHVGNG